MHNHSATSVLGDCWLIEKKREKYLSSQQIDLTMIQIIIIIIIIF